MPAPNWLEFAPHFGAYRVRGHCHNPAQGKSPRRVLGFDPNGGADVQSNPVRHTSAVLALFAALTLNGCAGTQVRALGTDTGHSAYDLSGTDLRTLSAEATRLCPRGHAVLREWQSSGQLAGVNSDSISANEVAWALSYDVALPQAQMSIVCQG